MLMRLVITQCSMSELYKTKDQEVIALAKTFERRRCGHIPDPIPNYDCLTSCINISGENKHRYLLATQDEKLRSEMRKIPGVPMVYIRRAVMIMEPPSPVSVGRKEELEREKLTGLPGFGKRAREDDGGNEGQKKKRKRKEPNPLSVKKRKPIPDAEGKSKQQKNNPAQIPTGDGSEVVEENAEQDGFEGIVAAEGVEYDDSETNVIGEVTDSMRRHKSTRRRKHHKKAGNKEAEVEENTL